MVEQKQIQDFKVFDLYDLSEIKVEDPALKTVINLQPKLILKSMGRHVQKHGQLKVNIIERLMNKLSVAGHRSKKHRFMFGTNTGKYSKNMKVVLDALKIVGEKTKMNPIQVLVKAVENSAPRDETTVIEYGGARYLQAVDVSPLRRVNIALRNIIHGASDRAFNKKKNITEGLAEEILLAYENKGDSSAVRKKNESEKQADSAR